VLYRVDPKVPKASNPAESWAPCYVTVVPKDQVEEAFRSHGHAAANADEAPVDGKEVSRDEFGY
jgi:hypothetical protein